MYSNSYRKGILVSIHDIVLVVVIVVVSNFYLSPLTSIFFLYIPHIHPYINIINICMAYTHIYISLINEFKFLAYFRRKGKQGRERRREGKKKREYNTLFIHVFLR